MKENKKDPMEQIILEDFQMEAEKIKKEIQEANVEKMPPEVKDRIREELHKKREARDREKLYAQLPEEDRKAMEIGREILKQQGAEKHEEKVVYFKKPKKMYIALAAVLVLVFAMGVTSVGGPKRVVQMIKVMIGDREIVRVETDENNYLDTSEKEDAAYEKIKEVFGVEPVKMVWKPEGTQFVMAEIDEDLQIATLIYNIEGKNIYYYISTHYTDSSWGVDVEDRVLNEYDIQHENIKIKIKEYEKPESKTIRYSANYNYKGLEYCLMGVVEKREFEKLVKNLKFF